jgi:dihydroorotase
MVARDLLIAYDTGCRLHLAHVSTEGSVRLIREAKERGIAVTAEATPHHLILSEEDMPAYDTDFKVNPPLRRPQDVRALREGIIDGTIDAIATDHAPHTTEDKEKEFDYAPFGVVGMESAFPVLFTELVKTDVLSLNKLLRVLTRGPAEVLGVRPPLYGPGVVEGARADMVILDIEDEWVMDAAAFASKGRNCPFNGRRVRGRIDRVFKNGKMKYALESLGRS